MKIPKLLALGTLLAICMAGQAIAAIDPPGCLGGGIQLNLYFDKTEAHVGEVITYTISASVGNFPPNCAIDAVTLEWVRPDGFHEWLIGGDSGNPPEDLAPGASSTVFTRTYTVDAADMVHPVTDRRVVAAAAAHGLVQNAIGPGSLSNDDDLAPTVVISNPNTLVGITVTAPTGLPGHPTNLIITEENTGQDPLHDVHVNVWGDIGGGPVLLAHLTAATASGDVANPGVLDNGVTAPPRETWQWTIGPIPVIGLTTFTAVGYGLDPLGDAVTFPTYPSEKAEATADIDLTPALTIDKTGPQYGKHEGPWGAGDLITYSVTITIGGDWPLILDSLIDDKAGDQSALLPAGPQGVGTVIGPLTYTYMPLPGDPDPLVNVVTVTAHADGYPAETASATDDHSVILLHPNFTVTKMCTTDPVEVGESAIFEITIANTGDADLDFTTDEPTIAPFSLAVGDPPAVYTVSILVTEGMTDVFNSIEVTAHLNARYNLPNVIIWDDDDTCQVTGGATRTPGFWQTHTDYTTHIATVHGCLPMDLGWVVLNTPADIFGMFWSNNAWNSDGTRRTPLCQAQVTVSFQVVAGLLNACLDNGAPLPKTPAQIAAILGGTDVKAIRDLGSTFGDYNESGDDVAIIDGDGFLIGNADPKAAKDTANYAIGNCASTGKTKGNK